MMNAVINEKEYEIDLFVFDKDGLLFKSRQFWVALAMARLEAVKKHYPELPRQVIENWLHFVGIEYTSSADGFCVVEVDPMGILAIASVPEEISATAAFVKEHLKVSWIQAKIIANDIFEEGDKIFSLSDALCPRKGFPEIFRRLRKLGIPYGIATSDTAKRSMESINLYDDFSKVQFTVTKNDVEKGKPSPDMLVLIQSKMGIEMRHIAMVGDSVVDVKMAATAGAIGIGIPEYEQMKIEMQSYATEIIESLDEIQFKERGK